MGWEREGLHLEHLDLGSGLLESGLSCTETPRSQLFGTTLFAVQLDGSPGRPRRADRRDRSYDERRRVQKRDRGCQFDPGCVSKSRSSGEEDSRRVIDNTDLGRHG